MRAHARNILLAGLVGTLGMSAAAPAQEARPATAPDADRGTVDVGLEAMRREVEAKRREWDRMFAKARAAAAVREAAAQNLRIEIAIDNQQLLNVWVARNDRLAAAVFDDVVVTRVDFDRIVFGPEQSATPRQRLDQLLETKVRNAALDLKLTPAEQSKLELAGRGDIKRLFDRVEVTRKKFAGVQLDRANLRDFLPELTSLRTAVSSNPFEEGSLFSKTLRKISRD